MEKRNQDPHKGDGEPQGLSECHLFASDKNLRVIKAFDVCRHKRALIVTAGPKSSQKHRLKISQPYNETQRCVLA